MPLTYITEKQLRITGSFYVRDGTGKPTHQNETWNIELGI